MLTIAFKDRDEVMANRERNADEPRPRGGRGGRGGGRGREHDRHSATGRVYVLYVICTDYVEILKRPLTKPGVQKPLPGNLQLQLQRLIALRKRRLRKKSVRMLQETPLPKRLKRHLRKRRSQLKHTPITLPVK